MENLGKVGKKAAEGRFEEQFFKGHCRGPVNRKKESRIAPRFLIKLRQSQLSLAKTMLHQGELALGSSETSPFQASFTSGQAVFPHPAVAEDEL